MSNPNRKLFDNLIVPFAQQWDTAEKVGTGKSGPSNKNLLAIRNAPSERPDLPVPIFSPSQIPSLPHPSPRAATQVPLNPDGCDKLPVQGYFAS